MNSSSPFLGVWGSPHYPRAKQTENGLTALSMERTPFAIIPTGLPEGLLTSLSIAGLQTATAGSAYKTSNRSSAETRAVVLNRGTSGNVKPLLIATTGQVLRASSG